MPVVVAHGWAALASLVVVIATALALAGTYVGVPSIDRATAIALHVVFAAYGFMGMLALHYRNEFLHFMNRATGWELFPSSIYGFTELPALIVPRDIILICGSALIVCLLGGVIPAWRAGRLKPVEALRYE